MLEKEVNHLKHVFITINGIPPWVVLQVIHFRVENEVSTKQINQGIVNPETSNAKQHKVIFPYKGKKGEHTLRNVKLHITKLLPEQEEVALVFTCIKLGTKFNIKIQPPVKNTIMFERIVLFVLMLNVMNSKMVKQAGV